MALLVVDTLRADMMEDPALLRSLPTMRRLFEEAYRFERAYAPSHWTLPSHASLFTGLPPHAHRARPPHMRLRSDVPTLAEIFRARGYHTACVTCNPWLSEPFGMTRGFEDVWRPPLLPLVNRLHTWSDRLSGMANGEDGLGRRMAAMAKVVSALVLSTPAVDNGAASLHRGVRKHWQNGGRPPFLVVNLMEAHGPYHARGGFSTWRKRMEHRGIFGRWERLKFAILGGRVPVTEAMRRDIDGVYWSNVRYMDAHLGRLLSGAPSSLWNRGYTILVSDHGQLLGEGGRIDHAAGLSEELIRVPLAIRPPGGGGGRVPYPTDISWLFLLLRAIAEGRPSPLHTWLDWVGQQRSVISEAPGGTVPYVDHLRGRDPHFREDLLAFKAKHDHPALACVRGRWKLVCHLGRDDDELYDLREDTTEEVNRMDEEKETLDDLHRELRERFLGEGARGPAQAPADRMPVETKRAIAQIVLAEALEGERTPVLVWTGGKDSTLVLGLCLEVARERGLQLPPLMVVDHGQHFEETWKFMREVAEAEDLTLLVAKNEPLVEALERGETSLPLERLGGENQEEALKAGLEGDEVPLSLDTPVGNHLLKTVALNRALQEHGFDTVITGIRWDENLARASEVFFSPRENPPHTRVHPILPWTEREVWAYTLEKGLPIHPLYKRGYRSFDGAFDSEPTDTRPAWEQDLETTPERAGRAQDKEKIMERLRALGYF